MRTCKGTTSDGSEHKHPALFECKKCGHIGCKYEKCSRVAFHPYDRCLKCGSTSNEPLPDRH